MKKKIILKILSFLILFVFIIVLFNIIKIVMIYNIMLRVYNNFEEFKEKENSFYCTYTDPERSSLNDINTIDIYYKKDDKRIRSYILKTNMGYEIIQKTYINDLTKEVINENIMKMNEIVDTTYSMAHNGLYEIAYITLPNIVRNVEINISDETSLKDKIMNLYMFSKINIVDLDDNGKVVLEFDEEFIIEKVWIDKTDFLVKEFESRIITEDSEKNLVEQVHVAKYIFKENIVTDDDMKWIDLTGKIVEITR